jgi:hypothetical protein
MLVVVCNNLVIVLFVLIVQQDSNLVVTEANTLFGHDLAVVT